MSKVTINDTILLDGLDDALLGVVAGYGCWLVADRGGGGSGDEFA